MQARPICRFPVLAFAALLLLSACLSASAEKSYDCRALGITFPGSMGGLPLVEITDFEKESPGLGVGLLYRVGRIRGDIYIYNNGFSSIPSGTESKMISDHFYAVSGEVIKMEKLGRYKDVKILTQQEQAKLGAVDFLHAEMQFTWEGVPMESHIYLAALSNQFVKIRFTFPAAMGEKAKSIQEAYLKEFGALLAGSRSKA